MATPTEVMNSKLLVDEEKGVDKNQKLSQ